MKKLFLLISLCATLFLLSVASYLALVEVRNECSDQRFNDNGLGLNFKYSCEWQLNLNTRISNEFVFDEEQNLFGPIAQNYKLIFENTENGAEVTISKFLQAGDGSIRSFDEEDEYEIISDNIVRFKTDNIWNYVEYYPCEDVPEVFRNNAEDCGSSFFPQWGKFATVVNTTVNDTKELELVDALVISIAEQSK